MKHTSAHIFPPISSTLLAEKTTCSMKHTFIHIFSRLGSAAPAQRGRYRRGCQRLLAVVALLLPLASFAQSQPEESEAAMAALAEANSRFAFALYAQLRSQEGNIVFSPYSISSALQMVYAGAAPCTADEMAAALELDLPRPSLYQASRALAAALQSHSEQEGLELHIANGLWTQVDAPLREDFLATVRDAFAAEVASLDFRHDPETARRSINAWISEQTRTRIPELFPAGSLDAMTRVVLGNAVYFNADWQQPFAADATRPEAFTLLNGDTISVAMMHKNASLHYIRLENAQMFSLPYSGGHIYMDILLPDAGAWAEVEATLQAAQLTEARARWRSHDVTLAFPRFRARTQLELPPSLQALGMLEAFSPGRADFSAMDGGRTLYLSNVLHEAFIEVDEQGSEAAAATGAVMTRTSLPIPQDPVVVQVDRPFFFFIRDAQHDTILFMARVLEPEQE